MPSKTYFVELCPWCMREHRRPPTNCLNAMVRMVRKYDGNRPEWINTLARELDAYHKSFNKNAKSTEEM
jgi:hypothetical protein